MPLFAQWVMPAPDPAPIIVGALCFLGGPTVIMAAAIAVLAASKWRAWRGLQIVALGCAIAFVGSAAVQIRFHFFPASVLVGLLGLTIAAAGFVVMVRTEASPQRDSRA